MPLDEAMKAHDRRIPPHLHGLIVAGLCSGDLGNLLDRFFDYLSIGADLRRKLWLSLAYPAMTAAGALALLVVVCLFLVGQFELIYKDFNIPLPGATRMLIVFSHVVKRTVIPISIVLASAFCVYLASRVLLPRALRRSVAGRLPLVGAVWRSMSMAEFCHLLALLVEGRLPLSEALRLTGEGIEDSSINHDCRAMAGRVDGGEPLSRAMYERSRFPIGLPRLIRWAETQKSVPEVLHMAGSMFEARARGSRRSWELCSMSCACSWFSAWR